LYDALNDLLNADTARTLEEFRRTDWNPRPLSVAPEVGAFSLGRSPVESQYYIWVRTPTGTTRGGSYIGVVSPPPSTGIAQVVYRFIHTRVDSG